VRPGPPAEYKDDDDDGALEEVDYESSPDECGGNGGEWFPDGITTIDGVVDTSGDLDSGPSLTWENPSYLDPDNAPSNGLSKYEQSLPNCWAVGGRAVLQAGADTLGPLTDAAGAVKQLAEEGLNMASMYYNNKAAFYSATTVNTAGTVGLLVPLRSSIYRGLLSTSAELGEAASGATLALFDYNLGKQIYNEITNPTPCR
jgi:hypothetical protein